MGYRCVLIQIRERRLMDLEKAAIPNLFEQFERSDSRINSMSQLRLDEQAAMADQPLPAMSLGKMASALHHLLTGQIDPIASPLLRAILGGTPLHADLGHGLLRYLWTDEVRKISTALAVVTPGDLRDRSNPASLKAAWLATPIQADDDDEEVFCELENDFRLLASDDQVAAACGNAMLIGTI